MTTLSSKDDLCCMCRDFFCCFYRAAGTAALVYLVNFSLPANR